MAIRGEDNLQALSDKLGQTVDRLALYYDDQLKIVDELSCNLDAEDEVNVTEYNRALQKLKNTVKSQS